MRLGLNEWWVLVDRDAGIIYAFCGSEVRCVRVRIVPVEEL